MEQREQRAAGSTGTVAASEAAGTALAGQAATESGTHSEGRSAAGGADSSSEARSAEVRLHALVWNCERSALYHKAREGFFSTCHRWAMAAIFFSGSAAAVSFLTDFVGDEVKAWMALVPALIGALDLAFGFVQGAQTHAVLGRRFLELAADASADGASGRLGELEGAFFRTCGEEPPTYQAVHALCHNQLCDVQQRPEYRQRVSFLQRLLRHLVRFSGTRFAVGGT